MRTSNKKAFVAAVAVLLSNMMLMSCTEAETVSYNISREADSFNVCRRITVHNTRSDTVLYQITGYFSLQNSAQYKELEVICRIGKEEYCKNFIYLNDWTTYIVEDLKSSDYPLYHYDVTVIPKVNGGNE